MCIHIYTHIYVHIYIHIYIHIYMYIHVCVHLENTHAYIYIHTYTLTHRCTCAYLHLYTHIFMYKAHTCVSLEKIQHKNAVLFQNRLDHRSSPRGVVTINWVSFQQAKASFDRI